MMGRVSTKPCVSTNTMFLSEHLRIGLQKYKVLEDVGDLIEHLGLRENVGKFSRLNSPVSKGERYPLLNMWNQLLFLHFLHYE